eukprot:scaffold150011_cov30-Tisochrysis_lutea.AAC.4
MLSNQTLSPRSADGDDAMGLPYDDGAPVDLRLIGVGNELAELILQCMRARSGQQSRSDTLRALPSPRQAVARQPRLRSLAGVAAVRPSVAGHAGRLGLPHPPAPRSPRARERPPHPSLG